MMVLGIPIDFVLFALTLLGVATIHHHTLKVALIGALVMTLYQLVFTGFKTGAGVAGLLAHAGHEWEVDEFLGDNAGLVVAEIELDDEAESFVPLSWLGAEVTHDVRYFNSHLASHPWREWSGPAGAAR